MATVSLTGPVGSRSQLVTNRFLIALGQVFGWKEFTSLDVTGRLGLDFLNTAKLLSRMSRKPYYLLSARRIPRQYGGYENVYAISPKGWRKIGYLQRPPAQGELSTARNPTQEAWATHYLLTGKGKGDEVLEDWYFQTRIASRFPLPPIHPRLDREGLLLFSFDPRLITLESNSIFLDEPARMTFRAMYLQSRGLIPQDINLALFVPEAYERGSSGSTILISLLIRGGLALVEQLESSSTQQAAQHTTSTTECEKCHHYETLCKLHEYHIQQSDDKISSLRRELDESSLEVLRLSYQKRDLRSHIVGMGQVMKITSDGLERFKDISPILHPIIFYVRYALTGIALMNYFAYSRNS